MVKAGPTSSVFVPGTYRIKAGRTTMRRGNSQQRFQNCCGTILNRSHGSCPHEPFWNHYSKLPKNVYHGSCPHEPFWNHSSKLPKNVYHGSCPHEPFWNHSSKLPKNVF